MTILVTGGTGTLGRPTVELLTAAGRHVRILSRSAGAGRAGREGRTDEVRIVGDLNTGIGLREALEGVDTVVHLATSAGKRDVDQTRRLLEAARHADLGHLFYISIVGVDSVPYPYYRAKWESEKLIEASGIPYTILRATQFHSFIADFLELQRRLPVILSLDVPDQPIAVTEVAERVAELVLAGPAGRVPDIGGPEQLSLRHAIDLLQRYDGGRKPVWTLRIPGKTVRAFREGRHMTDLPGFGRERFEEYAQRRGAERARLS